MTSQDSIGLKFEAVLLDVSFVGQAIDLSLEFKNLTTLQTVTRQIKLLITQQEEVPSSSVEIDDLNASE